MISPLDLRANLCGLNGQLRLMLFATGLLSGPPSLLAQSDAGAELTATARAEISPNNEALEGRSNRADTTTLVGKVMVGYQGWFNCEGDGARLGWKHWARGRRQPGPGNVTVDLWPDVSELDPDERFATQFKHKDGSTAEVFSSAHRKTVVRHFGWMREYGIDGAFVQRFANQLSDPERRRNVDKILSHARIAAGESGRTFALMYDLSGLKKGQVKRVKEDWSRLQKEMQLTDDERYLHHRDKPLVSIWGVGFSDDRQYTPQECRDLVAWFKAQGCAVMLGVPSFWREGKRDAIGEPILKETIELADVLSPWSVGRYQDEAQAKRHAEQTWQVDREWCRAKEIDFLPVVWPGFSWRNLNGGKLDAIPRRKGAFFWSQVTAAKEVGCNMLYVAMFDEVDEATAVFKCTNNPPTGPGVEFITFEGLPSDYYLKLTGRAGQLIRGEAIANEGAPSR